MEQTHLHVDAGLDPRAISAGDSRKLRMADLVMFVVDGGSIGIGMMMAFAHRHRAVVAVLAPPAERVDLSPLLVGMNAPHTLLRGATPSARLEVAQEFVTGRLEHIGQRRGLRAGLARGNRTALALAWTRVFDLGGPSEVPLPSWFSRGRLEQLLEDELSWATIHTFEVDALAEALMVDPAGLLPDGLRAPPPQCLSPDEILNSIEARKIAPWNLARYDQVLVAAARHIQDTAVRRRRGERVRNDVRFDDPEGWLVFAEGLPA